jgi:hypothetical protein
MIEAEEVESRGRLKLRRNLEPGDYKPSTCKAIDYIANPSPCSRFLFCMLLIWRVGIRKRARTIT